MDPAFERHYSEVVARERSGHTAVAEDNLLYVWGGYMVRKTHMTELLAEAPSEMPFVLNQVPGRVADGGSKHTMLTSEFVTLDNKTGCLDKCIEEHFHLILMEIPFVSSI